MRNTRRSDLALGRNTVSAGRNRPPVACLCYQALSEWHLGEIASCKANMAEAISLAKELNDVQALVLAMFYAGLLGSFEGDPAEVERYTSNLLELSRLQNFGTWLPGGSILRAWARGASGDTADGISWIAEEIEDYRVTGRTLVMPFCRTISVFSIGRGNFLTKLTAQPSGR